MIQRLFTPILAVIGAAVLIAVGCGGDGGGGLTTVSTDGSTATTSGGNAPHVASTSPANGAPGTATARRITATFSEQMTPSTLTAASFSASTAAGPLTGSVTYIGKTATLLLDNKMPANTLITATVTDQVRDASGVAMRNNYVWTFTTGASSDNVPPTVSSTDPSSGETGIGLNKRLEVVFSEAMDPDSLTTSTFKLEGPGGGAVTGTVELLNNVAQFNPTVELLPNTTYTATVTTGVRDLSDNNLIANHTWSFTTGTNSDSTAPRVISTDPAMGRRTSARTSRSPRRSTRRWMCLRSRQAPTSFEERTEPCSRRPFRSRTRSPRSVLPARSARTRCTP